MIKSFSCSNFRNVNVKNLKFSKINILIGPNNSGKTNFIKALSFCADMLNCSGKLVGDSAFQTMISKSGMGDIYNKYSEDSVHSINMKWHLMLDESKDVSYQFNFHTGNEMKDFFITCEKLDNNYRKSPASQQFNYFTCNEDPERDIFREPWKWGRRIPEFLLRFLKMIQSYSNLTRYDWIIKEYMRSQSDRLD